MEIPTSGTLVLQHTGVDPGRDHGSPHPGWELSITHRKLL